MLADIFGPLFAGIGLFFIGVKLIGSHLKQMTGRSFRRRVAWAVQSRWRGALVGALFGAITQSSNAVTFIVTSMTAAGLVTVQKALPVVVWANLGTSALVLVATVDFRLGIFILLGVVGVAHYFDINRSNRFRHAAEAMLGVSLLFLGLNFLKGESAALQSTPQVQAWMAAAAGSWLLMLLLGAGTTFVIQSSTAVSVIAVAMTKVGLLTMSQTMLVIYGSGLGSAANLWMLTAKLSGSSRQLAMAQVLLKVVAGSILLLWLWLELQMDVPGVKALVTALTPDVGLQSAWVYLLFQLVGCVVMTVFAAPVLTLLERWSPQSTQEALSSPQYLYEQALDDADTAMDLVEKEQARLLGFLPDHLSTADESAGKAGLVTGQPLLQANRAVTDRVEHFIAELMDRHQDRELLRRLLNLQTRTRLLADLRDNLHQLDNSLQDARNAGNPEAGASANPLAGAMVSGLAEPMYYLLTLLKDAAGTNDPTDLAQLRKLTDDRSDMMEAARRKLLQSGQGMDARVYEPLFAATSLFERLVWLVRQYSQLLVQQSA